LRWEGEGKERKIEHLFCVIEIEERNSKCSFIKFKEGMNAMNRIRMGGGVKIEGVKI